MRSLTVKYDSQRDLLDGFSQQYLFIKIIGKNRCITQTSFNLFTWGKTESTALLEASGLCRIIHNAARGSHWLWLPVYHGREPGCIMRRQQPSWKKKDLCSKSSSRIWIAYFTIIVWILRYHRNLSKILQDSFWDHQDSLLHSLKNFNFIWCLLPALCFIEYAPCSFPYRTF